MPKLGGAGKTRIQIASERAEFSHKAFATWTEAVSRRRLGAAQRRTGEQRQHDTGELLGRDQSEMQKCRRASLLVVEQSLGLVVGHVLDVRQQGLDVPLIGRVAGLLAQFAFTGRTAPQ